MAWPRLLPRPYHTIEYSEYARTAVTVRAIVDRITAIAIATAMKVAMKIPAMVNAPRPKRNRLTNLQTDHQKSQPRAEAATNSLELPLSQKLANKKLRQ